MHPCTTAILLTRLTISHSYGTTHANYSTLEERLGQFRRIVHGAHHVITPAPPLAAATALEMEDPVLAGDVLEGG